MSNFNRNMRRTMAAQQKKAPQTVDYALHKAQQLEILNQSMELLKNNVYGQTQVDIVLFALSEGKKLDEAVEFSLDVIDKMNEVNLARMQKRKAEIEEKMRAANPQNPGGEPLAPTPPAANPPEADGAAA